MTQLVTYELVENRKTLLMQASPWMVSAILKPDTVILPTEKCPFPWMATDGKSILYNQNMPADPGKKEASLKFFCFGIIHEIAHILCGHVFMKRQDWYQQINVKVMDFACECVANYFGKAFGFRVPEGLVYDPQYDGMTEWEIYHAVLSDPQKQQQVENMMGNGGKGADVGDSHQYWGQQTDAEASAGRAEAARVLADSAKKLEQTGRGDAAGFFSRRIQILTDETDWEHHLSRFLSYNKMPDYTYARPDVKRFGMMGGTILPSLFATEAEKSQLRNAFVACDTSGSVTDRMLARQVGSVKKIFEELNAYNCYAGYCDAKLHSVGPLENWEVIEPKGGGGTDFRPVFEYIEKELDNKMDVLVFFTDGMGTFPYQRPPYEVIWVDYGPGVDYPFGEVIKYKI